MRLIPLILTCLAILASALLACALLPGDAVTSVDFKNRAIVSALLSDPPTLDTTDKITTVASQIQGHVYEGLMRKDAAGQLIAGTAKSYELTPDGLVYTFHLRPEAKWSDGSSVTAYDFEFAWSTVCNPAKSSEYAFIMFNIKNAEAISAGKQPVKDFGAKAIDALTLRVEMERPCPYFLGLTTFPSFLPVKKELYLSLLKTDAQGHWLENKYASSAATAIYNGPFVIDEWTQNKRILLKKNPHYWAKEEVWLNQIDFGYITSDLRTLYNLMLNHNICSSSLDAETVRDAQRADLPIKSAPLGAIWFINICFKPGRPGADKNFRKALQAAINSRQICDKVISMPGYKPGVSIVPVAISGSNGSFRQQFPLEAITPDPDKARQFLALTQAPKKITLLRGDDQMAKAIADYVQNSLQRQLGIEVVQDVQTFKGRLQKSHDGDFDISITGWSPDYDDPLTFIDLFWSKNDSNYGQYRSSDYDNLIDRIRNCADPLARLKLLDQAQRHVQEEVVVLPLYETGLTWTHDPKIQGIRRNFIGADPSFIHARIVEEKP